jgi:hypothetical protein
MPTAALDDLLLHFLSLNSLSVTLKANFVETKTVQIKKQQLNNFITVFECEITTLKFSVSVF